MIIRKFETRQVEIASDVYCDRCGEDMHGGGKFGGLYNGVVGVGAVGSYWSPVFCEGDEYEFSACERCLSDWFKGFKHNPLVKKKESDV